MNDHKTGTYEDAAQAHEDAVQAQSLPQVPGFQVLKELGRTHLSIVYLGYDNNLHRQVVIKMALPRRNFSAGAQERLRQEAERTCRVQHPLVVAVFSFGEHNGHPFFVEEYVEGGDLAGRLRHQPQPPQDAARLVLLLTRAVQAAHEQGVLHRDLKPANILIAPPASESALNSAFGCPRIADFGLAQLLVGAPDENDGPICGTPPYMAPEQAEGRNLEIGPATDIYALGAILYEMLTGRPPFLGKDTKETLDKVIHEPLVPPRQLQPGVPGELEEICLRCLAKKPADRFPSATTLARDLQLFLDLKNLGWGVFGPRELLRSPGCSWGGGANPGPALWGKGLARDGRPSAT